MSARRTLLGELVDYAGFYPPASLDLDTAVRNVLDYRAGPDAWMLGNFVLPVARLAELDRLIAAAGDAAAPPLKVSAVASADALGDAGTAATCHRSSTAWRLNAFEARVERAADVRELAGALPDDVTLFVEPAIGQPLNPILAAARDSGALAKLRTGGVTPSAIPDAATIVEWIAACQAAGVGFKATAGLHHPVRGEYPLTYAADAPRAWMHGYVNLFLAAAWLRAGMSRKEATELLLESDPTTFHLGDDDVTWRGHRLSASQLSEGRGFARAFGSCSFREPVDESRAVP